MSVPVVFIVICSAFSFTRMVNQDIITGKLNQKEVVRNFTELEDAVIKNDDAVFNSEECLRNL